MNARRPTAPPPAWESQHWWSDPSHLTHTPNGLEDLPVGQATWPDAADHLRQASVARTSGGLIVVIGASGGCGATTLAQTIAHAVAARSSRSFLIDLDLADGDIHSLRAIPRARTIADLHPVIDEITPDHLDIVAHAHPSGVAMILSPGDPTAAAKWSDSDIQRLLTCARASHPTVVDLGRAPAAHRLAACEVADRVVLVCPPTLRGASRGAALIERHGRERLDIVVIDRRPRELSPRQLARMLDHPVALVIRGRQPHSAAGDAMTSRGRAGSQVRKYLASLGGWEP